VTVKALDEIGNEAQANRVYEGALSGITQWMMAGLTFLYNLAKAFVDAVLDALAGLLDFLKILAEKLFNRVFAPIYSRISNWVNSIAEHGSDIVFALRYGNAISPTMISDTIDAIFPSWFQAFVILVVIIFLIVKIALKIGSGGVDSLIYSIIAAAVGTALLVFEVPQKISEALGEFASGLLSNFGLSDGIALVIAMANFLVTFILNVKLVQIKGSLDAIGLGDVLNLILAFMGIILVLWMGYMSGYKAKEQWIGGVGVGLGLWGIFQSMLGITEADKVGGSEAAMLAILTVFIGTWGTVIFVGNWLGAWVP